MELEGYNGRWEERWAHTREIVAVLINTNVTEESKLVKPYEIMPLSRDRAQIETDDMMNAMLFEKIVGMQ